MGAFCNSRCVFFGRVPGTAPAPVGSILEPFWGHPELIFDTFGVDFGSQSAEKQNLSNSV